MGNIFLHFSEAFDYIEEKGCDQPKKPLESGSD